MEKVNMTFGELTEQKEQDKEAKAKAMFDKLREHIGEEVSLKLWYYAGSEPIETTNKLGEVDDFNNVLIGRVTSYPFVDNHEAIYSITSKDGEILYSNKEIANVHAQEFYSGISDAEVLAAKRLIFGDRIVDTELVERKKSKYTFMKEGLALIKPETAEEWLKFVDDWSKDRISLTTVQGIVSMMKKFEEGIPFEDAEKQVYTEDLGLDSIRFSYSANILARFAKQGEEYMEYYNGKYGVEDSKGKGKSIKKKW